jgi:hypothetical protein
MMAKGRQKFCENLKGTTPPRGENHSHAKLTVADVIEIRRARSLGVGQKMLAKVYNVRYQSIQAIDHRRTWNHV